MRRVSVLDIGKTNVKAALVDLESRSELKERRAPNRVINAPPWPHFDVDAIWRFLLEALRELGPVDAISITTHGASAALLDAGGALAAPVLDYEHPLPETAAEYDAIRPPFAETGSPRSTGGLNLGAQLHWMLRRDPSLQARTALILTYPQYWAHRLTGVAALEVTSLGSHTDLWLPYERRLSPLAERLGLADKFPPLRKAGDVLGPILPEIAAATGLAPTTPVLCGIHDSNASLYPHLIAQAPPFAVVSSGTWVICMAIGGAPVTLDPGRDTLINVNAFGDPVPSARFMGGRKRERLLAEGARPDDIAARLAEKTAESLEMIGARGPILVEGPLAGDAAYLERLSALAGRPARRASASASGAALGAALLAARAF